MRKIINKKTYNTDTAIKVKHNTYGAFGDPAGYEEILYRTAKGDYFVYGAGGAESKYPTPSITVVTEAEAQEF